MMSESPLEVYQQQTAVRPDDEEDATNSIVDVSEADNDVSSASLAPSSEGGETSDGDDTLDEARMLQLLAQEDVLRSIEVRLRDSMQRVSWLREAIFSANGGASCCASSGMHGMQGSSSSSSLKEANNGIATVLSDLSVVKSEVKQQLRRSSSLGRDESNGGADTSQPSTGMRHPHRGGAGRGAAPPAADGVLAHPVNRAVRMKKRQLRAEANRFARGIAKLRDLMVDYLSDDEDASASNSTNNNTPAATTQPL